MLMKDEDYENDRVYALGQLAIVGINQSSGIQTIKFRGGFKLSLVPMLELEGIHMLRRGAAATSPSVLLFIYLAANPRTPQRVFDSL